MKKGKQKVRKKNQLVSQYYKEMVLLGFLIKEKAQFNDNQTEINMFD